MANVDHEANDVVQQIAADQGITPREVWDMAARSRILQRQLLDPAFAALADEPDEDRAAFRRRIEEVLDEEQGGEH